MPDRRAIVTGLLATAAFPVASQGARLRKAISTIVPFKTSPFPYGGKLPDGSGPFLDVTANGRHGHTSPRGGIYWEDETYSDRSTLLAVPRGFDPARPAVIVVFFHGNGAILQRDVVGRQRVVAQVEASGLNAVLVAPQFASNAQDSSAGNFWTPGYFAGFMTEAAHGLAKLTGAKAAKFDAMPVVLVAYSGGYNPAAFVLKNGDVSGRLLGVILLDAVFDEADIFADWIVRHRKSFSSAPMASHRPPAMRRFDGCWRARASRPIPTHLVASKPAPSPSSPRMPPTTASSLAPSSPIHCNGC